MFYLHSRWLWRWRCGHSRVSTCAFTERLQWRICAARAYWILSEGKYSKLNTILKENIIIGYSFGKRNVTCHSSAERLYPLLDIGLFQMYSHGLHYTVGVLCGDFPTLRLPVCSRHNKRHSRVMWPAHFHLCLAILRAIISSIEI